MYQKFISWKNHSRNKREWIKKINEGFWPKVLGFDHFKFGDHKKLKKKLIKKNTAAIMVETIMGEAGIKVIPDWCLKELRKICDKNILLILMKFNGIDVQVSFLLSNTLR